VYWTVRVEPPILHLTVKMLYMSRRELSEFDAPDGRDDVAPYLSLVGGVCAGPYASPDAVVEPPIQALPDTYVLVIEDEPAVPIGYGFGELLTDLLAALTVYVARFPTRSGL
jgi:acetyl esterase/lipase